MLMADAIVVVRQVNTFFFSSHFLQVPKLKKSAVMITLVPEDAGKPTVKLEKVAVQDGTCTWENPVYEPVKLTMDSKTGKIHEKLYHFIVSTVWNRPSISDSLLFLSFFLFFGGF